MAFSVLIQLSVAGADVGPFNLYSDVDNFTTPFETNIPRSSFIPSGYVTNLVPNGASTIRLKSVGGCVVYNDLLIANMPSPTPSVTPSLTPTPTPSPLGNVTIYGRIPTITTQTASVYYKIDAGSYSLLGNIYDNICDSWVVNVTPGSTIYVGILSGSEHIAFAAQNAANCSSPGVTSYCGTITPYSTVISGPTDISVNAKVVVNGLAVCTPASPSATPSVTPSLTTTPSITPTISITPTVTPSISVSPTVTPSITVSPSVTPSITVSTTPSVTPSTSYRDCTAYQVQASDPFGISIEYTDCNGNYTTTTVTSYSLICAETGTVNQTGGNGTISAAGAC